MEKFDFMKKYGYEQLVLFHDKATGLKGVTAIHDTTLGPSLGGTRMWVYENEEDAILDALRLARGMTYKNAAAGLNLGGGKTVIIGDSAKIKSEELFRAFGRYVQSLNGRYITAADVGTTTKDMGFIKMETDYVVGLEGKSGDPSPITALGAFYGIKAALKYQFGNAEIKNYTYAVQGIGKTGAYLIDYLFEEKAKKVYFTDINEERIKALQTKYPQVVFVKPDDIYNLEVDVFVPCALGAILNEDTIPRLKAKIVAGTANNVLKDEIKDAQALKAKKILYAPDFVINAGGVINVYHELIGYNKDMVIADVKRIYDRLLEMFKIAEERNISTQEAANVFAEERIKKIHNIHRNFIPR
ncbi:MAG: Glu/Leu/Phe/Val dehydrogenase [Acholeplasmatales bacterium]|jgi:leucine dehydrogenase|nr:leucine dehydrogenase [Acholeplasmataceae bacterium]MDY0114882.1 Glu/Leu/Phe/Val dehydrogenase [Acholeplasmatales bacterium]MCK9233962.1 leucine dehydrogenase [Acholeplasmataceae bacterium]MCK9289273.1 leucine dehydrogenase [Acholeplasmataceae bacterium]MCK9427177.1 leucine dehydrogenase [Acholeplasmataceae bacterium]